MNITKYVYKDEEFEYILNHIKHFYSLDYLSYESGVEDWAILSDKSGNICMIHAKLKLIFSNFKRSNNF